MLAIQIRERIIDIAGLSSDAVNLLERFSSKFNQVTFGHNNLIMSPDFQIFLDILDSVKVVDGKIFAFSKGFMDTDFEIQIKGNRDIGYIDSNNEWEKFYGMGKEHISILQSKIDSISK